MHSVRISTKLLLASAILGIALLFVALTGAHTLQSLMAATRNMENNTHRALLAKRVDALVLAVVMDSRGIYMSRTSTEAEKFAAPLLVNLGMLEDKVQAWEKLVPPDRRAVYSNIRLQVDEFVATRKELVRLARQVGTAEARAFGDNDQNRAIRQRLNTVLEEAAIFNDARVVQIVKDLEQEYISALLVLAFVSLGGLVIGMVVSWSISSYAVSRPIIEMTQAMGQLAAGDHTISIPWNEQNDEIGLMGAALAVFRQNAVDKMGLERQQADEARRVEDAKRQALVELASDLEVRVSAMLARVSSSSSQLEATSLSMAMLAERTGNRASSAVTAAGDASGNAKMVADAASNLSVAVTEIGTQVEYASRTSRQAVEKASQTEEIVLSLSEAANEIGKVVGVITGIASQTNLLALNASIEASRAGDAGKGFSVVAGEVKALAQQTVHATHNITGLILSVQQATHEAVEAIEGILSTITIMDETSSTIAAAVEEQQAATREIARNVESSAGATSEIAHNLECVLLAAGETGRAAVVVSNEAHHLSQSSDALDSEIQAFLTQLRVG